MRRLNVLYLPHPVEEVNRGWGDIINSKLGESHAVRGFDREKAAEPQFQEIEVIVDLGGNITGTHSGENIGIVVRNAFKNNLSIQGDGVIKAFMAQ